MRIRILCLAASALLAASPLAARADSYTFTISTSPTNTTPGTTFVVSGTLSGTLNLSDPSNPAIDLTSITGAGQGYTFTGVVPLGSNPGFAYDNLVFTNPNAVHVDALGDLLTLSSPIGTSLAHVYNNGTYHVDVFDPNDPVDITPFAIDSFILTPTPSAVPEPSSWLLLATGILALATAAATRKLAPRAQ
ncbi:MAG: sorting protein [Edaphobacter sp.]|nr:sorting protein [Edaphobacter sp.]